MKIATSGDILKIFKSEDSETILRTTNIRTFTKQNNIKYHIVGQIWAIDFEDFMSKINPYKNLNHYPIPRIRTIASSFKEFNKTHKTQINNHMVERCLARNKKIPYIKYGRIWLINYDILEKEIIKQLKKKGIPTD